MLVRSPLHRWVDPEQYTVPSPRTAPRSAYVFPTLDRMGFGYGLCAGLARAVRMHWQRLAWVASGW
jgi:hypothetical protein